MDTEIRSLKILTKKKSAGFKNGLIFHFCWQKISNNAHKTLKNYLMISEIFLGCQNMTQKFPKGQINGNKLLLNCPNNVLNSPKVKSVKNQSPKQCGINSNFLKIENMTQL